MAARKNFNTPKVLRTNMTFPQAVIAGDFIFVSGTTGIDTATGSIAVNDFEAQALQAFKNVQTIIEEAGSSISKIVRTTIYMVAGCDSDFKIINKVYSDFFKENPPARSAPQVMPFPGNILVSVECIAMV
ncbi:RidA family protein [Ferruginibacter profundus]